MSEEQPHILVVDDDKRLRELIGRFLGAEGFRITTAVNAADARGKLKNLAFDLLVLDIMMPGETGLQLTESLRADNTVPILLLTAMGEAQDRINGFEVGADDYLPKPFEPKELVLRIQSILKRARGGARPPTRPKILRFGGFLFEMDRRRLFKGEAPIYLTAAEGDLLARLARRAGEPVSREELAPEGAGASSSRLIDVQMTRLRKKVETDPRFPRYLQTVRGRGYVLQPD